MADTKMAITLTPEMALALEAGMKDAVKAALGKESLRAKVASDQKMHGIEIDVTLKIDELSIGHDTDKAPTCSIPLLPTLALLVKRMGFQRDAALALLREVMTEAITMDEDAAKKLAAQEGVAETMKTLQQEVIATLPRTPVEKSVKAKGSTLTVTGVRQTA
jgi:hypothetical protein